MNVSVSPSLAPPGSTTKRPNWIVSAAPALRPKESEQAASSGCPRPSTTIAEPVRHPTAKCPQRQGTFRCLEPQFCNIPGRLAGLAKSRSIRPRKATGSHEYRLERLRVHRSHLTAIHCAAL